MAASLPCPECTFLNESEATACSMCFSPLMDKPMALSGAAAAEKEADPQLPPAQSRSRHQWFFLGGGQERPVKPNQWVRYDVDLENSLNSALDKVNEGQGFLLNYKTSSGVAYEIWKGSPTEVKNPKEAPGSIDASWGGELGSLMVGGFDASNWEWASSELPFIDASASAARFPVKCMYQVRSDHSAMVQELERYLADPMGSSIDVKGALARRLVVAISQDVLLAPPHVPPVATAAADPIDKVSGERRDPSTEVSLYSTLEPQPRSGSSPCQPTPQQAAMMRNGVGGSDKGKDSGNGSGGRSGSGGGGLAGGGSGDCNNKHKRNLCRNFKLDGRCRWGINCKFAHGTKELCLCSLCHGNGKGGGSGSKQAVEAEGGGNDQRIAELTAQLEAEKKAKAEAEAASKKRAKAVKAKGAAADHSGESAPRGVPLPQMISEETYKMFLDPITDALMADPVVLVTDGNTYDRSTLDRYFKAQKEKIEEQAAAESPADDTSCGAGSRIQLKSPLTNEPTDGRMAPNRFVETQIVEMVAKGNSSLTTDELEEWHDARAKKSVNDAARREDEKRMQLEEEQRREQARLADQRRAQELAARVPGKDDVYLARHAHLHDTGLACALCPPTFAQPEPLSLPQRCMLPGCARLFDSRAPGGARTCCKRCSRSVCESCSNFGVTEFSFEEQASGSVRPALAAGDAGLENICAECVVHLIEVVESGSAGPGSLAHLTSKVHDWESRIMDRASKHQELEVEAHAFGDFARKTRLEAQIAERKKELAALEATAQEASEKAEAARSDEGTSENELARVRQQVEDAQAKVDSLQAEYHLLLRNDVKDVDEDDQLSHFEALSGVASRLEEAEVELVAANEEATMATSASETSVSGSKSPLSALYSEESTGSQDVDALNALLYTLKAQEVPTSDDDLLEYIAKVSEVESQLEAAEFALAEARSQSGEAAAATVAGGSGSAVERLQALGEEYNMLLAQDVCSMSDAEAEAHVLRQSVVQTEYDALLMASQEDLPNEEGSGGGSLSSSGDDAFMAHWGKRNAECVLPLDLAYPTPAMLRRMESLRLRLAEARVAAKRATDARMDEECRRLTTALEGLEDQVRAARARVSEAQDSADAEMRAAGERRARRAAEEAERAQREAARRAEELEAAAARERHEADERATRAAFSSMAGRDGGAAVIGGRGDVRMCGRCKAGPIENKACSNLSTHNDYSGEGASRVNHCPNCDWFDGDWHNWPAWDGIPGPH